MCEEGIKDASGWDVLCAAQRFSIVPRSPWISASRISGSRSPNTGSSSSGKLAAAGLVELEREADAVYVILSEVGRKRLRLFRRATGSVLATSESELAHARRSSIVMLLGKAELALETPEPRPWWLNE